MASPNDARRSRAARAIAALTASDGRFAPTRLRRAADSLLERAAALPPRTAGCLPCQVDAGTHCAQPLYIARARVPLRADRGFTLVEMLVAMGILVLGFTSLIGLLGVGVSTRRTAELRNQAVQAVDTILHEVAQRISAPPDDDPAGAARLTDPDGGDDTEAIIFDSIPGYERLRAVATVVRDEARPSLLLVVVKITWFEEGVEVGEQFQRVLPGYEPFSRRAARARSKS